MRIGGILETVRPGRPWLVGIAAGLLFQTVLFVRGNPGGAGVQPIAFNHAKHVESGVSCTDCHRGAATEEHATVPDISVCMGCHEAPLTKSPEEARLRAYAAAGAEIPWRPVTHVAAHVYFSHRRHVTLAKLDCATCHGAMQKLTAPPRAPFRALTMDFCIQCHQRNQARTDCNDCHR